MGRDTKQSSRSTFKEEAAKLLPEDGNYNLCLTCGLCSSACPASGLEGMDPRKFLRLATLGMDEVLMETPWVWMCTMCQRCTHVCPMQIDIPRLVYHARNSRPEEDKPRGIVNSCKAALNTSTSSAMGTREEDFKFVVEDVLEEVRETQEGFEKLEAPLNKENTHFFLNQNSREPMTEPDEMVPLWKILHVVGADWTYGTTGWAAENYCMFAADESGWKDIVKNKVQTVESLGSKVWLNTE